MSPNDAEGMANSVDPDQTALIWVCTVCPDLSVQKLRNITVFCEYFEITFYAVYTNSEYCNDPKFSDRYAWANSADPDQQVHYWQTLRAKLGKS